MMIMVIVNYAKGDATAFCTELINFLKDRGCEYSLHEYDYEGRYPKERLSLCDAVIAVGGDGTIIHSAKAVAKENKSILGVNTGSLGFTAGMETDELDLIQCLLDGKYVIQQRMMLEADIISDRTEKKLLALNDIVVSGEVSKIMDYSISMDNNRIYSYRADGFIVSTPTGSTAYALSAGGPVIDPSISCIEYTPICPHSLFNRSMIFGEQTELKAIISKQNTGSVYLSADGGAQEKINGKEEIIFRRAAYHAKFISFKNKNFYDILNKKII